MRVLGLDGFSWRFVLAYGLCPDCGEEPMMVGRDARMTLRAALYRERRGYNKRSEFDA